MKAETHLPRPPKPRTRPAPSERDQRIYVEYQTGRRQTDLAADYKLAQCRISQIVRRVQSWLASASADARRLERELERQRLSFACRQAIRHFQEPQKCVTHKHGTRGDKAFDETTERTLPASVQFLKVVLQTSRQLGTLEDKPPLDQVQDDQAKREEVEAWLIGQRNRAQLEGKVTADPNNGFVIRELVKSVCGEPNSGIHLNVLASDANKKIRNRKRYDDTMPPLPHVDGWYAAVHDEDGDVVGWRPADAQTGDVAVTGCGGGTIQQAPVADEVQPSDATAQTPSADHAAAGSAAHRPPPESPRNTTCADPPSSPQPSAPDGVAAKTAEQKKLDRAWDHPPPPDPRDRNPGEKWPACFDDPIERRWRHRQRLEKLREMRRKGLPCIFTFYREDGPIP